jgi:hypothetical protein
MKRFLFALLCALAIAAANGRILQQDAGAGNKDAASAPSPAAASPPPPAMENASLTPLLLMLPFQATAQATPLLLKLLEHLHRPLRLPTSQPT